MLLPPQGTERRFFVREAAFLDDQHKQDKQSGGKDTFRALAHFSHIGMTMAASVLIGVLLGKRLDAWLGTSPWLLLVFSFLGVGAAIRFLFKIPGGKDK